MNNNFRNMEYRRELVGHFCAGLTKDALITREEIPALAIMLATMTIEQLDEVEFRETANDLAKDLGAERRKLDD